VAGADRALLRRRAARVADLLHQRYGSPRHGNKDDPLDELVFILLSQMTTHWSYNRVFDRLKAHFPTWDGVLKASEPELRHLIEDAGLSRQKAPRIQKIVSRAVADFGHADLSALRQMSTGRAEEYLCSLPGVGVKTAKCVLMYAVGRPVLPVDTHVWRVCRRLGLVGEDVPYPEVHEALESVVPPRARYRLHVNGIMLGRQVCKAKRPLCGECPLAGVCPFPTRQGR